MFDLNGDTIRLDNGTPLVYLPLEVKLDLSRLPAEKTAGARMKKYEIDKMGTKDGKLSDNDIVLFRYADVLLMRSEAKVRNGENGDEELNAVRFRVGMLPRKATLENILAERQLELAWEGWRGRIWCVLESLLALIRIALNCPMNRMAIPPFSQFPIKSVP